MMATSLIRIARIMEGYPLHEVSARTQISMGRLSYIERGVRTPTPDEYKRLTKVLPILKVQSEKGGVQE